MTYFLAHVRLLLPVAAVMARYKHELLLGAAASAKILLSAKMTIKTGPARPLATYGHANNTVTYFLAHVKLSYIS